MTALLLTLLVAAAPASPAPQPTPAPASPPPAEAQKPAGAPAEMPLPKLFTATLDNGLTIIAFERHDQPIFIARLAIPAGVIHEPAGKSGLAEFTAGALTKGTLTRPADEIIDWLDTHGASFSATSLEDFTVLSAQGLSRDLDDVLSLMADSVLTPAFPKQEVERLRPQMEAAVRERLDDPGALAELHADALLYGPNHPLGRPETLETLAAIDQAAIASFHQTYYRPNGAVLIVAGDFNAQRLLGKAKAAFEPWAHKDVPPRPPVPALAAPRIRVVNRPDSTQAQIRIAHVMPPRGNPDTFSIKIMNAVLGSGFGSRLLSAIRETEGKTYTIQTAVDETATVGEFNLTTSTRNAEVASTLQKSLAILAELKRDGPTEEELARARGLVGGGFVVNNSELRALVGSLLEQAAYGLGDDYVRTFRGKAQAVTVADAKAAAARYLLPPGYVAVLVGDAKAITAQAQAAFPSLDVEVRDASAPITGAPSAPTAMPEAAELKKARELFAAAIQAVGSEEVVRQARAGVVADGAMTVGPPGSEQTLPFTAQWQGNKQRVELRAPGALQVMVLAPGAAFSQAGDQVKDLPAQVAEPQRAGVLLNFPNLLWLPEQPEIELAWIRDDVREDDGVRTPISVVEVRQRSAQGSPKVLGRLHFDAKTHLPYGYLRSLQGRQELLRFLDYRKQGALLFPMKRRVKVDGQQVSEVTLQRVELRPVPDSQFARPR